MFPVMIMIRPHLLGSVTPNTATKTSSQRRRSHHSCDITHRALISWLSRQNHINILSQSCDHPAVIKEINIRSSHRSQIKSTLDKLKVAHEKLVRGQNAECPPGFVMPPALRTAGAPGREFQRCRQLRPLLPSSSLFSFWSMPT